MRRIALYYFALALSILFLSVAYAYGGDKITGTVTDIDGNVYQTVTIGTQVWMMENLKVTHYRNGDPIPNVTDGVTWSGLTSAAYCEYDNDPGNVATYGRLYNWYAVGDSRDIAPSGWHVPTDAEWKQLEMYLGMSQSEADAIGWRGTDEGGKLKEAGTTHWISPNTGATNESGFTALPSGYRDSDGHFSSRGGYADFWLSTEVGNLYAWSRRLYYTRSQVDRNYTNKHRGYEIRCVRDDISAPEVSTDAVSDITPTTSQCGGNVVSDGGSPVIARGVCWSTSPIPTIADDTTFDGTDIGSYISSIYCLSPNTTYYIRAYATNSIGTGYGNIYSFTTTSFETGTVTDIDGNIYQTVKIGNQWWMAENLKVTHYRNGDPIQNISDNSEWAGLSTGAYCEYENDPTNGATYGNLYNWYAVDDSRNIAPAGWHVPSDAEWKQFEMFIGMSQEEADGVDWRGTAEGGKLKEAGTTHWNSPNTGATNESGFTALSGGYRSVNAGYFYYIGYGAFFWSSTEFDSEDAWYRGLHYDRSEVYRIYPDKPYGFSIRCVRDDDFIGLLDNPNLQSITIYEQTGSMFTHNFDKSDSRLTADIDQNPPTLGCDFKGTPEEYYDIYVSDINGNLDENGDYLTIECYFDYTKSSAGNNVDAISLNYSGETIWATNVASYELGVNPYPETNGNADKALYEADGMITYMGMQYSRITLGFEPTSNYCQDFEGLFCDDFDDGVITIWQALTGSCAWLESGGVLSTANSGSEQWCIQYVGDQSWDNYILEAKVKGNSGVDKVLVFRIQDANNYYAVNLRSDYPSPGIDQIAFDKMENGIYLADVYTVDFPSGNGIWYPVRIDCEGDNFSVFVNGQLILEYTDSNNPFLTGGVGMACWTGYHGTCDISFDNIQVMGIIPHALVTPTNLSFESVYGGANPEDQTFTLTNIGDGTLQFSVTPPVEDWITVSPLVGEDNETVFTVSIDNSNLTPGTYNTEIQITCPNADNPDHTVYVENSVLSTQNILILIPGVMGTHLYQEDGFHGSIPCEVDYACECWLSLDDVIGPYITEFYLDNLKFDENGQYPEHDNFGMGPYGLIFGQAPNDDEPFWDEIPEYLGFDPEESDKNVYGDLIDSINNMPEYEIGDNFFIFPYDWRFDNIETAESLASFVDERVSPGEKVDIIAHSMGGLVTRLYANSHPDKVDKAIFIATPHHGSLDILEIILGAKGTTMVSPKKSRELAINYIPAFELLPDPTFFGDFYQEFNALYKYSFLNGYQLVSVDGPNVYTSVSELLSLESIDRSQFESPVNVYKSTLTNSLSSIIDPYVIAGFGVGTPVNLKKISYSVINSPDPDPVYSPKITYYGDGRVPLFSARDGLSGIDENSIFYRARGHSLLPNDVPVIKLIKAILIDSDVNNISHIFYSDPRNTPSNSTRIYGYMASPITLEFIDTLGNKCYYDFDYELSIAGIPNSYFQRYSENEAFSIPDSISTQIIIHGLGEGTFSLYLNYGSYDDTIYQKVLYNIPVDSGSYGEIAVSEGGLLSELSYDFDGDGIFEDTLSVTEILEFGAIEGIVYYGFDSVSNVMIYLKDSIGIILDSVFTDINGYYKFDSLDISKYMLNIMPPTGYAAIEEEVTIIIMGITHQIDFSLIESFVCGDASGDEGVNILDVTFLINYLYKGGPPPDPPEAADVNNDGGLNILDVTFLINYLYKGGPEPDCP